MAEIQNPIFSGTEKDALQRAASYLIRLADGMGYRNRLLNHQATLPEIMAEITFRVRAFILSWAAERSERDEQETNPVLAYQASAPYREFFLAVHRINGDPENVSKIDLASVAFFIQILVTRREWERQELAETSRPVGEKS